MFEVSDKEFDALISEVMDELPKKYIEGLTNIVITYEDAPSLQQRTQLKLRCNSLLFGLYEGVPRTARGGNQSFLLPDKITLFKQSLLAVSTNIDELRAHAKHTLWHEIAHYYGLDHDRIHEIEKNWRP